jgi:hypothetical protein
MLRMATWDRDKNAGRVVRPWRAFVHPQLGAVEVGGVDPRIGLWNPPPEEMPRICATQAAHYLRVAALAPAVALDAVETTTLSPELTRVTVTVANHGYLPTYILSSAKALTHNEALWADANCTGCELADPDLAHREIGHLDGWGRGLFGGTGALYYMQTRGTTGARTVSWVVRGRGVVSLKVGSCRVGWTLRDIQIS